MGPKPMVPKGMMHLLSGKQCGGMWGGSKYSCKQSQSGQGKPLNFTQPSYNIPLRYSL